MSLSELLCYNPMDQKSAVLKSEHIEKIATDEKPGDLVVQISVSVKTAESRVYQIHRFNGQNFQLWRRQMEIYMTENKLKPYILGLIPMSAENTQAWEDKDAGAQAFLMRGLKLDQLKHLTSCTTAAQMWSKLKTIHSEKKRAIGTGADRKIHQLQDGR